MLVTANFDPAQRHNRRKAPIANGVLGMLIFVITEVMFFAALISAYLVLRAGALEWPPWGQPRLPVAATAFNSVVLLLSGWVLFQAYKAFVQPNSYLRKVRKLLAVSILLGTFFVLFQGYEWLQLISFGLTITSSTYGSLFYLVIGTHALHAIIALLILFRAYSKLAPLRTPPLTRTEFVVPQIFWYFVVGVWPVLYITVYLV